MTDESQCCAAYADLIATHERVRAACQSEIVRRGLDDAFACGEHKLRVALSMAASGSDASCPGGRDFILDPSEVEAMLAEVWSVCRRLLDVAAQAEDDGHRLALAGAAAHLMRDVIEPQFRAYPEYRSKYGV